MLICQATFSDNPKKAISREVQKRTILDSTKCGGGVVQIFHLFCPRLWHERTSWTRILRFDWLPEPGQDGAFLPLGIRALYRKENLSFFGILSHIYRLDIGLVIFFACLWTLTSSRSINSQIKNLSIHLDLTLGQLTIYNEYFSKENGCFNNSKSWIQCLYN